MFTGDKVTKIFCMADDFFIFFIASKNTLANFCANFRFSLIIGKNWLFYSTFLYSQHCLRKKGGNM